MLTIGSLFSGIGGLELGLERTGSFRTIWQCEINPYASAVLKNHWPEVPNLGDITKVDWNGVQRPEVICGGFPCQDISVAGKRRGIHGARSGLWKEFSRAITATKPKWVIIENSPELIKRGLGTVLQDLRVAGYVPLRPLLLRASGVGARHRRERIFIVAHIDSFRKQELCRGIQNIGRRIDNETHLANIDECRCDDGNSLGSRGQILSDEWGDCEKDKQEQDEWERELGTDTSSASNIDSIRKQRNDAQEIYRECRISWWHDDGEFAEIREGRHISKPLVCRGVYGVSCGMDRIKCLGNAVVPQVAQIVGELILEMEKW